MEKIIGTGNRILEVDLSDQRVQELSISEEDRWTYLGGKGLGMNLLAQRLQPGVDPLGEKNWLAFMPGVLLGTDAPCSGRFSGLTKSPLTGIITHASCGGPFGLAFKTAGYDGLLITGKSETPTVLNIGPEKVTFEDAAHLWGLDTRQTQAALIRDNQSGALVIGPAGERAVRYANIASGRFFLNRGGMGAVMGAKNVKAIVAHGGAFQVVPKDMEAFRQAKQTAKVYIKLNPLTGKVYPRFGTASHVSWCNKNHILPVKNFSAAHHPKAVNLSGEAIAFTFKTFPQTCAACGIQCGHATSAIIEGRHLAIPDYDALAMLGPNLGVFDARHIILLNELCGLLGMDPISTGATLAWSMEAAEKKVIPSGSTFKNPQDIDQAIEDIAFCRGWGGEMARGTRRLSETYGGREYAMQVKGLEIGAYDPRGAWGQGLGYAVANAGGCHRASGLFAVETCLGLLAAASTQSKARWVAYFENLFAATESLQMCQLTAFAFLQESPGVKLVPEPFLKSAMTYLPFAAMLLPDVNLYARFFSAVTGYDYTRRDFLKAGERIHFLERLLNTKEGIRRKDDTLPQRLLMEWRKDDPDKFTVPLDGMLDDYYAVRGYDDTGVPTLKKLESLGLSAYWDPAGPDRETTRESAVGNSPDLKADSEPENIAPKETLSEGDGTDAGSRQEETDTQKIDTKSTESQSSSEIADADSALVPDRDAEKLAVPFTLPADDGLPPGTCRLITPGHTFTQRCCLKAGSWVLGRAISAAYCVDKDVRQEFDDLPDDFCFAIAIGPLGPRTVVAKSGKGKPCFLGIQVSEMDVDLFIQIKGAKIITDLFAFRPPRLRFFPEQRVIVKGDMAAVCRIGRILAVMAIYLLPARLARQVVREYPDWSYYRKYWGRLRIGMRALIGF